MRNARSAHCENGDGHRYNDQELRSLWGPTPLPSLAASRYFRFCAICRLVSASFFNMLEIVLIILLKRSIAI